MMLEKLVTVVITGLGCLLALSLASEVIITLAEQAQERTAPAGEPANQDIYWSWLTDAQTWIIAGSVGGGVLAGLLILAAYRRRQRRAIHDRAEAERLDRIWTEAVTRHDTVRDAWMGYQNDIDAVLSMPLLADVGEPRVARFISALGTACDLATDKRPTTAQAVERYADATRAAETTWHAALAQAKRARLSRYTREERGRIKKVQRLMAQAMNTAATPEERRTYYATARDLLGDLIRLPEPTRVAIELDQHARRADIPGVRHDERGAGAVSGEEVGGHGGDVSRVTPHALFSPSPRATVDTYRTEGEPDV